MILKRAPLCSSFFPRIALDTGVQVFAILGGGGECRAGGWCGRDSLLLPSIALQRWEV